MKMENTLQSAFPSFCDQLIAELMLFGSFTEIPASASVDPELMKLGHSFVIQGRIKVLQNIRGQYFLLFRSSVGQSLTLPAAHNPVGAYKFNAEEKSIVINVSDDTSESWMCRFPVWRAFIEQSNNQIMSKLLDTLWYSGDCLENRILAYLNDLAKTRQDSELHITHSELAEEIGSVREVVSRSLKKLEKLGKLNLHRGKITLHPIQYQSLM
jgi:CRP/FNR family transcriptional regulator, anaerobic regulatory protein